MAKAVSRRSYAPCTYKKELSAGALLLPMGFRFLTRKPFLHRLRLPFVSTSKELGVELLSVLLPADDNQRRRVGLNERVAFDPPR